MFNLPNCYYLDLVREFYPNIPDKKARDLKIDEVSSVRGRKVHITKYDVSSWLNVPKQEEEVDLKKAFTPPSDWNMDESLKCFNVKTESFNNKKRILDSSHFKNY